MIRRRVPVTLLLVCLPAASLAAQDTTSVPEREWVMGASVGVPVDQWTPAPRLFTLAGHATRARIGAPGADLFVGTMPRIVAIGALALGARAGIVWPLAPSEDALLLPSGGASLVGVLGGGGGGVEAGVNVGAAVVLFGEGVTGFRAGLTWHHFPGLRHSAWLLEVGIVRRTVGW